jgi:hypothetical protein
MTICNKVLFAVGLGYPTQDALMYTKSHLSSTSSSKVSHLEKLQI